jgi:hypothetical protein
MHHSDCKCYHCLLLNTTPIVKPLEMTDQMWKRMKELGERIAPIQPTPGSIPNGDFVVKDSGARQEFQTGAVRDTQESKPRFDLVPVEPLERLANLYGAGAIKYGDWNWQKGMPLLRMYASLLRHVFAWRNGDRTEDHLAAVVFNAFGIMWTEQAIKDGKLPKELAEGMPE